MGGFSVVNDDESRAEYPNGAKGTVCIFELDPVLIFRCSLWRYVQYVANEWKWFWPGRKPVSNIFLKAKVEDENYQEGAYDAQEERTFEVDISHDVSI